MELVVGVQNHRHQVHQRKPVVLNLCTGQLYKPLTVFKDAFVIEWKNLNVMKVLLHNSSFDAVY